jgi:ubiquinone/menaquinone biosynthesis C-methylase UbiE
VLGDVEELEVLDAACVGGENATWLRARGAHVVALDASTALADLARPLPFSKRSFDLVVSSLTLHQLQDWRPALREFARILRRPGWLVFTMHQRPAQRITDELAAAGFRVRLIDEARSQFVLVDAVPMADR